jgi:hypothetical protein
MLLSVLDGHGADGSAVSSRAMTSIIAVLGGGGAESKRLREDPAVALTAAFEAAQTQLVAAALRKARPPVIGMIRNDRFLMDARTLTDGEVTGIVEAFRGLRSR